MEEQSILEVPQLVEGVSTAKLGDRRLTRRLSEIVASVEQKPDESFPRAMSTVAETEALYRFLRNPRVSYEDVLKAHFSGTIARAKKTSEVIVVHDSTEVSYASASQDGGFYRLQKSGSYGYLGHFSLCVSAASGCPFGLVDFQLVERDVDREKVSSKARWRDPNKESRRWVRGALRTAERLNAQSKIVHVMDREADSYEILVELNQAKQAFVIRQMHDRRVDEPEGFRLVETVDRGETILERDVKLSPRTGNKRPPSARKKHPPRKSRLARLAIKAESVRILRPASLPKSMPEQLSLNVVRVTEPEPPNNEKPVDWNILTTLPVETVAEVERVVDLYRGRWLIEDYFKALKTGCALRKRLPESLKTALTMMAILAPVAWQLLLLRHLERASPTAPATKLFSRERLKVLRRFSKKGTLPPRASIRHVLTAIAELGGYLKSNGPPGWQVLGRGFQRLLELEEGWQAAMAEAKR